jgi:uncharacterized membrane protein YvlD (DUF360 family)
MKNGQSRQSSFSQQNRPDAMSYLVEGQANPPSPSQGPMHARHPSHLDWTYTDSPSHPQANSYPSPRSFGNQQRPADEWVASNWGMSPSAMTFDGHFPPGAPHPPFPNGHQPPDMARGHSGTSQFSPPFIQTNFPGPNSMHMPPFARLPLSGYELLAAKLAGSLGGPPVKPIYRRFAALGHRLMLHLQDELSELEDQLKALDAADTQSRQHPNGIFPASRRQESPNPNAPPSQRTELLGRIGYKICQYQQVISSFRELQELPSPTMPEVHEYRTYLAAGHPVVDEEGRFLDVVDDLAELTVAQDVHGRLMSEAVFTPMPRPAAEEVGFPPDHHVSNASKPSTSERPNSSDPQTNVFLHFVLGMIAAVLAPVLTFLAVPNFMGRMTVVLLVWSGVLTALTQTGVFDQLIKGSGMTEGLIATVVYMVAMAIIASAVD